MKPLSETNPYLKDKRKARLANARSARTSCGVEGIVVGLKKITIQPDTSRSRAIYLSIKNSLDQR